MIFKGVFYSFFPNFSLSYPNCCLTFSLINPEKALLSARELSETASLGENCNVFLKQQITYKDGYKLDTFISPFSQAK